MSAFPKDAPPQRAGKRAVVSVAVLAREGLLSNDAAEAPQRGQKRQQSHDPDEIAIARPLHRRKSSGAPPRASPVDAALAGSVDEQSHLKEDLLSGLKAIVISLERRPDRWQGCLARLADRCPGLQAEFFRATDGRKDAIATDEVATSWHTRRNVVYQRQRSVRKGWDDLHTYQERLLDLSPGERGCSMSHVRAWRRCLELAGPEERPLLVLEDDAAPTAEFSSVLSRAWSALPSDAGVLYLGYSQAAGWRREVGPELVEAEYVWTTVGYVIWPAAARLLLSKLPVNEPVDNWMAGLCAEGELKAYCVRPKIVLQADAWNVNSDVGHSDEHYWGPCSDIRHSDELYWGSAELRERDAIGGSLLLGVGADDSDSEDSWDES